MKRLFKYILPFVGTIVLAGLVVSSCQKQQQEYSAADYNVEVSITDGNLHAGVAVYPVLTVSIDGPDERIWRVNIDAGGLLAQWFSVSTGSTITRKLSVGSLSVAEKSISYSVRIYDQTDGMVLYKAILTASLTGGAEEISDDTERVFSRLDVVTDKGTLCVPVVDGIVDEAIILQANSFGRFDVRFSPFSGRETFLFDSSTDDLLHGEIFSSDGGVFSVPFSTGGESSGQMHFTISCADNAWRLSVPYQIKNDSPGDEPDPSKETICVKVSAPAAAFEGKAVSVHVLTEGLTQSDFIDLTLLLDGEPYSSLTHISAVASLQFIVGADGELRRGTHHLSAILSTTKTAEPVTSDEVKLPVFGLSYRWTASDGGSCQDGLKARSTSSRFFLDYETAYPEAILGEVTLKEKDSSTSFSRNTARGNSFIVPKQSRGLHAMQLTINNDAGVFVWDIDVKCYDLYSVELSVSGSDLNGRISGPGNTLPSKVWVEMGATVGAYIPYTEAVGASSTHVTYPKGQYIDLERYKRQYEFSKGSSCGTYTLESKYVSKVVKYIKDKASTVKATTDGASRWVESGGTWVKEFYTPKVYPCLTLSFWGTITGATLNEYVLFDIDTSSLKEYLEKEDMRLVVGIPYWE